jgi:hypothetical protein
MIKVIAIMAERPHDIGFEKLSSGLLIVAVQLPKKL